MSGANPSRVENRLHSASAQLVYGSRTGPIQFPALEHVQRKSGSNVFMTCPHRAQTTPSGDGIIGRNSSLRMQYGQRTMSVDDMAMENADYRLPNNLLNIYMESRRLLKLTASAPVSSAREAQYPFQRYLLALITSVRICQFCQKLMASPCCYSKPDIAVQTLQLDFVGETRRVFAPNLAPLLFLPIQLRASRERLAHWN